MDDFSKNIEQATLVILHAGAGSLIHAMRASKVPVVMPRQAKYDEIVDDHQVEFALELEKSGKVVVAMEADELEGAVTRALARQTATPPAESPSPLIALVRKRLEAYAAGH